MGRILSFTRKRHLNGAGATFYLFIDQERVAEIENGKTVEIEVDENEHRICVCADMFERYWSDNYLLPEGNMDRDFLIYIKTKLMRVDVLIDEIYE